MSFLQRSEADLVRPGVDRILAMVKASVGEFLDAVFGEPHPHRFHKTFIVRFLQGSTNNEEIGEYTLAVARVPISADRPRYTGRR